MTTATRAPWRSAPPPRYRNTTGGGRARPARPARTAPRTPPGSLRPTFTHASVPPPPPARPAPKPSSNPFSAAGTAPLNVPALHRPATASDSWLTTPFRSPADQGSPPPRCAPAA
ncbi:hypothetical protein SMD44_p10053 (plasmid) [Streptomyces alboflavus]|uniref:Uncharacterized protein n=1 Tax=Streptomyces alboflavus TaxID=67267 RepID=A0A291W4S7_9ACTN|nr:hypothetical protein [Streptomyces alboflavus]ATM24552.1 hypothetical protein SMD44_p10053 [Streptomyces alboflavus]